MPGRKEMRLRNLITLILVLLFPAIMVAQSESASSSTASSPNRSVKQRLEEIRAHFVQISPEGMEASPLPARVDPRSREAHQNSSRSARQSGLQRNLRAS